MYNNEILQKNGIICSLVGEGFSTFFHIRNIYNNDEEFIMLHSGDYHIASELINNYLSKNRKEKLLKIKNIK